MSFEDDLIRAQEEEWEALGRRKGYLQAYTQGRAPSGRGKTRVADGEPLEVRVIERGFKLSDTREIVAGDRLLVILPDLPAEARLDRTWTFRDASDGPERLIIGAVVEVRPGTRVLHYEAQLRTGGGA